MKRGAAARYSHRRAGRRFALTQLAIALGHRRVLTPRNISAEERDQRLAPGSRIT